MNAGESMRTVPLSDGSEVLVDAEDYEWLSQYRWQNISPGRSGPARLMGGRGNQCVVWMHREILGLPRNPEPGDWRRGKHLNGNLLDNRRSNLAIVTPSQDQQNMKQPKRNPESRYGSRFIGVRKSPHGEKWSAVIKIEGKRVYLGSFRTEKEAAIAYDIAAREHYGPTARTNFPEE